MVESPRSILSWLRRCRRDELPVDRVLDSIQSIYGVVPLGGRVDGTDGVTPPATPKTSSLSLYSAKKDAKLVPKSGTNQNETTQWTFLLTSVQLPSKADQNELQKALEMLQNEEKHEKKPLSVKILRQKFFTMRRQYFEVRIELFRVSRDAQHPSKRAAQEIINKLLKDELQDVLLDEIHGRQFYFLPVINGIGKAENKARELQFLEEETLLRELLLLTLVTTKKNTTLDNAVKIVKTVQNWEIRVLDEIFTANTLALPKAQQLTRKLTQIGVLVAVKVLYNTDTVQDFGELRQVTNNFFLTELSRNSSGESVSSSVPGVLLLAWAAVLGRQYRKMTECNRESEQVKELKRMLETTLAAAERLHSFFYLNALLRSLVFSIDDLDSEMKRKPFLLPMSVHATTLWALPNVAASAGLCGTNTALSQQLIGSDSAFVYQEVVAEFLNDMLSSLGYLENIDGVQQLHAMVKFVLPALSNVRVSKQILGIDMEESNMMDITAHGETAALRELLTKTRAYLPHSLLPCIQMLTALCHNNQNYTSLIVVRQVLKYFSTPRAGLEGEMIPAHFCRPLPPPEYVTELQDEPDRLQCSRAFAYDDADGRLVVPVGTVGTILGSSDAVQVEWLLSDGNEGKNTFSLWDLLFQSADRFVAGLQSGSFVDLYCTNSEDVHVLTSFFEFVVQLGQHQGGEQFAVEELKRRWGEARLCRWWVAHKLSSPEVYVSQLLKQHIALPTLLSASRENLVSWGIRDRYIREQILVQIGDTERFDNGNTKMAFGFGDTTSTMASIGVDGGIHFLRLLLKVLDGFLHKFPRDTNDDAMKGESAGFAVHLHLVAASFIALRTVLATTSGVELLMNSSLGGGQEKCINLIVRSAKKFFEVQERLTGEYPVVLAVQDIFMSVVRWFLSKEAQSFAKLPKSDDTFFSRELIASERLWYVSAADFAIEVLSIHEGWKFVTTTDRCEVTERCFRLLYVLVLPRKYTQERNDMVLAFKSALRETLATDMPLLVKLLRSSCAVLSPPKGHMDRWSRNFLFDNGEDSGVSSSDVQSHNDRFPLRYTSEFDRDGANMMQLESLVTTCLRLVALLITNQSNVVDAPVARKILLTSIDGGGSKERKLLTIVTLCGGYLGYSLEKAFGIVYWSLQILQHAAIALDYREERESRNFSSMHSLIALFHGYQDLDVVRGVFVQLLRVSSTHQSALQKEVIELLTLCLEHQPGFLALLLFGEESNTEGSESEGAAKEKMEGDPFPFVTSLERFLESSERLLEQASDFFCAVLTFLVHVWKGAIHNRLSIHLRIMAALREHPAFWLNVTRALKIYMSLDTVDERGLLDMELSAAIAEGVGNLQSLSKSSEAYIGRSSAYGYMARSLILLLVSYEWHNKASKEKDHPLVDVLESFRNEGLFSHWLRTFTRLDYSPAQLELYTSSIRRVCDLNMLTKMSLLSDIPVGCISLYIEGLICNASTLKWQLSAGGNFKLEASPADVRMLKFVQWSNLQAAYLHAQLFLLSKWKVFMELCCLQAGEVASSILSAEKPSEPTTLRRSKRKGSTISSPPRYSRKDSTRSRDANSSMQLSASVSSTYSSEDALPSSLISGDQTMVRVLADVIKARVNQHENQDQVLDCFVLLHLHDLVQLLVSMLHHELCLVVRKTRDPKLSQTRQHLEEASAGPNFELDAGATLTLLAVIEKTISAVHDSMEEIADKVDLVGLSAKSQFMSAFSIELTSVPLVSHLVTDYTQRVESLTDGLLTSLFTAAILLVRHLSKIDNHSNIANRNIEQESISPPKSLLQVKLIGQCMNVIAACDDQPQSMKSSQTLFELSRCLFQKLLDSFSSVDASVLSTSKLRTINVLPLNPFVRKLEHEEHGISALFYVLVQRFRPSQYSTEVAAKQEEACQTLRGLVAVVWNPTNSELCQRFMLKGKSSFHPSSRLRLISILAIQLLPLLQTQMEREEATSKLRGYMLSACDSIETDEPNENGNLERSIAHQMWCLVLDFVGGLLRLQANYTDIASDDVDILDFMSSAEPLLLSAVGSGTCQRLTTATVAEHQALLRLLNALSGTATRRKRWREAFPTNCVVLMEQSRQLLWRACVLLGSSSVENGRLRAERMQKEKRCKSVSKAILGFDASCTPNSLRSPRSPSAFTYAHQTLLYDCLQAVEDVEKRNVSEFHRELETKLVVVVQLASLLLTKWTASLTDRDVILVVDGVQRVDEEQLVPLLAFIPPSEARSMNSSPGLGHLSLAMDFLLDQLLAEEDSQLKPQTTGMKSLLVNAINSCALLFLKIFLLFFEQYELDKRDRDELNSFFRQFNARLSKDDSGSTVGVDVELLQYIGKIIAG